MIKLVIFDADNTLYSLNSKISYSAVYSYLSKITNKPVKEIERIHKTLINEVRDSTDPALRDYVYTFNKLAKSLNADVSGSELYQVMKDKLPESTTPLSEILHLLKLLKEKNIKVGICTNTFRDMLEIKLNQSVPGWEELIDFIITPTETNSMKPSKKFYEMAIKKAGVRPEESVAIGDSWENDLEPAKDLGIKTILVSKEKEGTPDFWITDVSGLEKLITGLVS